MPQDQFTSHFVHHPARAGIRFRTAVTAPIAAKAAALAAAAVMVMATVTTAGQAHAQTSPVPEVVGIYMATDNPSDRYATVGDTVTVTVVTDIADTVLAATATEPSTAMAPRLTVAIGGTAIDLAKTSADDGSGTQVSVFEFVVAETTPEGEITASYRDFDQLSALTRVTVDRSAPTVAVTLATSNSDGSSVAEGDTVTVTAAAGEDVAATLVLAGAPEALTRTPAHAGTLRHDDPADTMDGNSEAALAGAAAVFVRGGYAYVAAADSNALEIVDISNPASPSHEGAIFHDDPADTMDGNSEAALAGAAAVFVRGNYAYVAAADSNALEIVDISNPVSPTHTGAIFHDDPADTMDGNSEAALDGAAAVFVRGNYAYVAAAESNALQIVDVSDPASPSHAGTLFHDDPADTMDGNSEAALDGAAAVFVRGDYAYVAAAESNALQIVDVSDPTAPTHAGAIFHDDPADTMDGNSGAALAGARGVFVLGNQAYVAAEDAGALAIIDISDPASPTHAGAIVHDDPDDDMDGNSGAALAGARGVFARGSYAYVAAESANALQIIDVFDPANPAHAGAIVHDDPDDDMDGDSGATLAGAAAVFVRGDQAYVAAAGADAFGTVTLGDSHQATVTATAAHVTADLTTLPIRHAFFDRAGNLQVTGNFPPFVAQPLPEATFMVMEDTDFRYTVPVATFSDWNEGDTLSYLSTSAPDISSWLTFDRDTRVFMGRPDNGDVTASPVTVAIIAADAAGATAAATFRLSVLNVNDAPEVKNDDLDAVVRGPVTSVNVLANDLEVDVGQTLAVTRFSRGATLAAAPAAAGGTLAGAFGTLAIAADGTVTHTPGRAAGDYPFTYEVDDGSGAADAIATAVLTVRVSDPLAGERPVIAGTVATQLAAVGLDFRLDLSGLNLIDPDGPDSQVALSVAPAGGGSLPAWLEFDPETRVLAGAPDGVGDVSELELAVTPSDGDGNVGWPVTFMLLVRETALSLTGGFSLYEDRLRLRVTQVPGGVAPSATLSYALVVTSPTVSIATGSSAAGRAHTVTVDIPAAAVPGTVHETVFSFDRAASPGANPGPNDISVALRYPAGADNSFVIVGDALMVQRVPTRRPSGIPAVVSVLEDVTRTVTEPWTFTVPATAFQEPDGEPLTYAARLADDRPLPDWLRFAPATRTFSGTPPSLAVNASYRIKVIASDPQGYGAANTFTLDFRAVAGNNPPTLVTGDPQPREDAPFRLDVTSAFADNDKGDVLTFQAARLPAPELPLPSASALLARGAAHALPDWLGFDGASGVFSGTPDQADVHAGGFTVVVTANDGRGGEASYSFSITPVGVNDAPVAIAPIANQRAVPGQAFAVHAAAAFLDEDGDDLSFAAAVSGQEDATLPAWLAFDADTGSFSGTPPADALSAPPIAITVTATDGSAGGMVAATFTIVVTAMANQPPVATAVASQRARAGADFAFVLAADAFADADGDSLRYRHSASPAAPWLSLDAATGAFSGMPPATAAGTRFAVTVTADDGWGGQAQATFSLAVGGANSEPTARAVAGQRGQAGLAFAFTLAANTFRDANGDTLTYSHMVRPAAAWLSFDAGTLAFAGTPPAAAAGQTFQVTVTADDGYGGQAQATFAVVVEGSSSGSVVAFPIPDLTAYAGLPFSYSVPRNAFDGGLAGLALSAAVAGGGSLPSWLSFDGAAGRFFGQPATEHISAAGVRVALMATGGLGGPETVEFRVTVAAAPAAGSLVSDGDEWLLSLPYVVIDLPPPADYLSCASLRLTAPESDLLSWSGSVVETAPLGCGVTAGAAAIPSLGQDLRLEVPMAETTTAAGRLCFAMAFLFQEDFELLDIAAVECQ